VTGKISDIHDRMASHDQNDYAGLGSLSTEISTLEGSMEELELRWLELTEALGK
jgi:ABC transport system ATP-binding/permease protein